MTAFSNRSEALPVTPPRPVSVAPRVPEAALGAPKGGRRPEVARAGIGSREPGYLGSLGEQRRGGETDPTTAEAGLVAQLFWEALNYDFLEWFNHLNCKKTWFK